MKLLKTLCLPPATETAGTIGRNPPVHRQIFPLQNLNRLLQNYRHPAIQTTAQNTPTANIDFTTAVEQYEKKLIEEALQHSKNLREAGKLLNVNASTVSRKIKQYHINYPSKK